MLFFILLYGIENCNMFKKLKHLIANRFTVILLVFVVWMLFFDQNNMMRQYKLTQELNEARQKEQYYKNEIKNDSFEVLQLKTDIKAVEKLGREKYNMKEDDETIFLIVREDEKKEGDVLK